MCRNQIRAHSREGRRQRVGCSQSHRLSQPSSSREHPPAAAGRCGGQGRAPCGGLGRAGRPQEPPRPPPPFQAPQGLAGSRESPPTQSLRELSHSSRPPEMARASLSSRNRLVYLQRQPAEPLGLQRGDIQTHRPFPPKCDMRPPSFPRLHVLLTVHSRFRS